MMPARIELDFAPRRLRFPVLGSIVLALGAAAIYFTLEDYRAAAIQSDLIAISLARYEQDHSRHETQAAVADPAAVSKATAELSTPWSRLFEDLEVAAAAEMKDVALLEIAPDRNKSSVRISGEARNLAAALDYMQRLQSASSIAYPLLENHEVKTAESERPVQFVIVADWRLKR